jgi:putative transposase
LVLQALNMAVSQRRPKDVIHHSEEGAQYTSIAFGAALQARRRPPFHGERRGCYDNAMCESFFATLECELLDRTRFQNQAEARMAVFDFIEGWYNPRRRHSALGNNSPLNHEKAALEAA